MGRMPMNSDWSLVFLNNGKKLIRQSIFVPCADQAEIVEDICDLPMVLLWRMQHRSDCLRLVRSKLIKGRHSGAKPKSDGVDTTTFFQEA